MIIPPLEYTKDITDLITEGLTKRNSMGPEFKEKIRQAIIFVTLSIDPLNYKIRKIDEQLEMNQGLMYKSFLNIKKCLANCNKEYWEITLGQLEYLKKVQERNNFPVDFSKNVDSGI